MATIFKVRWRVESKQQTQLNAKKTEAGVNSKLPASRSVVSSNFCNPCSPLRCRSTSSSRSAFRSCFTVFRNARSHRLLAHSAHAPLLVITIFSSLNTSLYSTSHSVNQSINRFWATVCKTVRRMLSVRCLSVCPVCDVRALWPNGWTACR